MVSTAQLRWIHRLLFCLQGVLALATIWLLVAAVTHETPQTVLAEVNVPTSATEHKPDTLRPLAWYAPFWQRDFRQPPIPQDTTQRRTTPSPPELPQLLGTFIESGQRFAHFRTANGQTRVHPVNTTVDSCEIIAIENGRVLLRRGQDTHWIEVPRPSSIKQSHTRSPTR